MHTVNTGSLVISRNSSVFSTTDRTTLNGYTKTYRATGLYRALRCSVIGRWAGFVWSAVINTDYRIPDDDMEA